MLDGIDALTALETFGTVSEAAARLRLTQSAVSKRLQALEAQVGFRLVEPQGRRLRLTPRAIDFLDRARPLVSELRGLLKRGPGESSPASLSLALSDSIASSFGPRVVRSVIGELPDVTVEMHAHRSVLVVESVRLGRYDVGFCTELASARDLVQHPLYDEPLVFVNAELAPAVDRRRPLIIIEPTSATFRAVHGALSSSHPELLSSNVVAVESFGAVLSMVREGFGNGVLPLGLALDARLPARSLRSLPGIARRLSLSTRKTLALSPPFVTFRDTLARAVVADFAHRARERLRPL
jgi:DNA-binding transcriptional LysR family regulator